MYCVSTKYFIYVEVRCKTKTHAKFKVDSFFHYFLISSKFVKPWKLEGVKSTPTLTNKHLTYSTTGLSLSRHVDFKFLFCWLFMSFWYHWLHSASAETLTSSIGLQPTYIVLLLCRKTFGIGYKGILSWITDLD